MYLKILQWEIHLSNIEKYFHLDLNKNGVLGLLGITYFTGVFWLL